jgi:hypothetical protein
MLTLFRHFASRPDVTRALPIAPFVCLSILS